MALQYLKKNTLTSNLTSKDMNRLKQKQIICNKCTLQRRQKTNQKSTDNDWGSKVSNKSTRSTFVGESGVIT